MTSNVRQSIFIFPWAMEISFLHTKGCGIAISVRNEEISPYNISIYPLINHHISKKINKKIIAGINSPNKISTNLMGMNISISRLESDNYREGSSKNKPWNDEKIKKKN